MISFVFPCILVILYSVCLRLDSDVSYVSLSCSWLLLFSSVIGWKRTCPGFRRMFNVFLDFLMFWLSFLGEMVQCRISFSMSLQFHYSLFLLVVCLIFRFWFKGLKWFYFRSAFFWSLLAISPLVLLRGALVGITGINPYITVISILVFLYLIFLLLSSVRTITKVMDVNWVNKISY